MSAQEILIEEIKRQPEEVAQEVLRFLKFIERQCEMENVVADTWEKLGTAPSLESFTVVQRSEDQDPA